MSADESSPIDPHGFVEVVFRDVFQSAVEGSLRVIQSPPGRRPSAELMALHEWLGALSEPEQLMVQRAMSFAADSAVFGLLCLLDNVRPVTAGYRETLSLKVRSAEGERELAAEGVELHELFRSRVDEGRLPPP